jgi:hypothetical protein
LIFGAVSSNVLCVQGQMKLFPHYDVLNSMGFLEAF